MGDGARGRGSWGDGARGRGSGGQVAGGGAEGGRGGAGMVGYVREGGRVGVLPIAFEW